jgi:hypothetical protein
MSAVAESRALEQDSMSSGIRGPRVRQGRSGRAPAPPGIEAGKARTRGHARPSPCAVRGILAMPGISRRRVAEARSEASRIFYGDVPISTIGIRASVPVDVATIRTSCSNCERWQGDEDGVPLLDPVTRCTATARRLSLPIGKRLHRDMHYSIPAAPARHRVRPPAQC